MASLETDSRLVLSKYDGPSRRLLWTTIQACLGALNFGYVIGYSSPAIPSMINSGVFEPSYAGWFGSLMTVGAIVGGPTGGWCIDRFGRRKSIMIASVPFLLGWLAMWMSSSLEYIFAGRLLSGFGSGLVTVCVPVYIAEISTKSLRGVLGSCTQLFITIGILMAYSLGLFFEWRALAVIAFFLSLLSFFVSFLLPESPTYLLSKKRKAEAIQSLKRLRDPHTDVQEECRDMEEGICKQDSFAWREFLHKQELSRPLFISLAIFMFQQLSGINVVMFYTVTIFEKAIPKFQYAATVVVGVVQVLGSLAACKLMDRVGRRKLLINAGLIMSATMFTFGLFNNYAIMDNVNDIVRTFFPILCILIYIVGFSLGWGPIPGLIMSEIFPSRARGPASSIAVLGNWVFAFIITKEFTTLQKLLGQDGAFYLFGFFCMLSVLFVIKYLPETKGKSLEDIELYFLGRTLHDKSRVDQDFFQLDRN